MRELFTHPIFHVLCIESRLTALVRFLFSCLCGSQRVLEDIFDRILVDVVLHGHSLVGFAHSWVVGIILAPCGAMFWPVHWETLQLLLCDAEGIFFIDLCVLFNRENCGFRWKKRHVQVVIVPTTTNSWVTLVECASEWYILNAKYLLGTWTLARHKRSDHFWLAVGECVIPEVELCRTLF